MSRLVPLALGVSVALVSVAGDSATRAPRPTSADETTAPAATTPAAAPSATSAPIIETTGPYTVEEGATVVASLAASNADTLAAQLAWSITGGADAAAFTLIRDGRLSFTCAKDIEAPDDVDGDGDLPRDRTGPNHVYGR